MILRPWIDVLLGEFRPGVGLGHARDGLRRRKRFPLDAVNRHFDFIDRKDGCSGLPVEHIDIALLSDLSDRIDLFPVAADGDQVGWCGQVAVPDIMMHELIMPDALAGIGVQRQQTVGEEVVALSVSSVKIEGG